MLTAADARFATQRGNPRDFRVSGSVRASRGWSGRVSDNQLDTLTSTRYTEYVLLQEMPPTVTPLEASLRLTSLRRPYKVGARAVPVEAE